MRVQQFTIAVIVLALLVTLAGATAARAPTGQTDEGCQPGEYTSMHWSLTGNTGTDAGPNFLDTTDDQPVVVKANEAETLRIRPDGQWRAHGEP